MAGEDTVVPVTTLSRCYSERRIDHATAGLYPFHELVAQALNKLTVYLVIL